MPIPQVKNRRLGVFVAVVFALVLTSHPSFASQSSGWLSPSNLHVNFGPRPVGTTTQLAEVLTNRGAYPVTISSTRLPGAGFRVANPILPLKLGPGASVTLTLCFAPTTSSQFSTLLTVIGG